MITVRELAADLDASDHDVMVVLADIHELVLSPDSGVREEAAAIVRSRLRSRAASMRNQAEDNPAGDPAEPLPRISLDSYGPRSTRKSAGQRGIKKSEVTDKSLLFLLEQHVRFTRPCQHRIDYFHADELQVAQARRTEWARRSLDQGIPLEDKDIHVWLVEFPDRVLAPADVLPFIAAGLKPRDLTLRIWYGRENRSRPTLFERITWGDLSITEAAEEISKFRSSPGS